jgi:hypothetical protein
MKVLGKDLGVPLKGWNTDGGFGKDFGGLAR